MIYSPSHSRPIMPKTRSGKCAGAIRPVTPYQRRLAGRKATSRKAPLAATTHESDERQERRRREPSFTEWENMSSAAIDHLTEALDAVSRSLLLVHGEKLTRADRYWRCMRKRQPKMGRPSEWNLCLMRSTQIFVVPSYKRRKSRPGLHRTITRTVKKCLLKQPRNRKV
jgi:hypothetical protein